MKSLAGLNALRQLLIEKYHEDVGVNLQNSRYLSIVFTNSPLNQQNSAQRAQRASETAKFVALNYQGIKEVDQLWIYFVDIKFPNAPWAIRSLFLLLSVRGHTNTHVKVFMVHVDTPTTNKDNGQNAGLGLNGG